MLWFFFWFFFHIFHESTFMRDCRILAWECFSFFLFFLFPFIHLLSWKGFAPVGWLGHLGFILYSLIKFSFNSWQKASSFSFSLMTFTIVLPLLLLLLLLLPPLSFYVRSFLPACRSFWCLAQICSKYWLAQLVEVSGQGRTGKQAEV